MDEIERLTRERDEARREADRFRHGCTVEGDFVCPNEYAVSELTAERNFLRALKKNYEEDFTRVCKERDEARAEVERLSESAKAAWEAECVMREQCDRYHAEWKQERQEVERLRAEADRWKRSCNVFRERDLPHAFQITVTRLEREVSDAHDQLARLRRLSKPWEGDAYRRGAEAMRLACQQWCRAWENNGEAIADALADLRVEDDS